MNSDDLDELIFRFSNAQSLNEAGVRQSMCLVLVSYGASGSGYVGFVTPCVGFLRYELGLADPNMCMSLLAADWDVQNNLYSVDNEIVISI